MTRISLPLLIALTAIPAAAFAQIAPPYRGQPSQEPRPCPSETFAVEAPLWAPAFPSGFPGQLSSRLSAALKTGWFICPPGTNCARGYFTQRVSAILPDYSNTSSYPAIPASRRDGHLRFFQVDFLQLQGTSWVRAKLRPEMACHVVGRIRTEVSALMGSAACSGSCTQPRFLVSRECLVQPLDVEAWLDPSAQSWARDRIALPGTPVAPAIDVALVDTGVPPAHRSALGVQSEQILPSFFRPNPTQYHPHGAHMATLIRSVAPNANIRSYRALDDGGVGSIGALARAMDDATFPSPSSTAARAPMVMNLSLGFPPHVTRPAWLTGPSCGVWEDGLGESVRYVLDVATGLDLAGPPLVVVAAGGNQVLDQTPSWENWAGAATTTPCSTAAAPSGVSAFFPAAFSAEPSCRLSWWSWGSSVFPYYAARANHVLTVGASSFDDRISATTIRGAEPLLVAPGERVIVAHTTFPTAPHIAECDASVGLERGFESPASLTGSSLASAFVSGAMAHVLGMRAERLPGVPWNTATLSRFVYLTGRGVCRTPTRPVRRLEVARIQQALDNASGACFSLVKCLSSSYHASYPIVGANTYGICQGDVQACFGSDPQSTASCLSLPTTEPGWPSSYVSSLEATKNQCLSAWHRGPGPSSTPPAAGTSIYEDIQLGGLQPQPILNGCPNCDLIYAAYQDRFDLGLELADAFPPYALLSDPYVVIMDASKRPVAWIALDGGPDDWVPGRVFQISFDNPGAASGAIDPGVALANGGRAALDMELRVDGKVSRVISPLRADVR